MLEFCDILADHANRYVSIANAYRKVPRNGQAEHELLMKATLHGTPEEACALLVEHYTRTLHTIEELFNRDSFASLLADPPAGELEELS